MRYKNGQKHRPRRGRTAFTVVRFKVIRLLGYTDIPHNRKNLPPHNPARYSPPSGTAYSVTAYRKFRSRWSLHMRLNKVRPLSGTVLALMRHTPKLRMNRERPCIALQKVVFCELKGHVLQCKRRPFATCWKSTACVSRSVAAVRFAFHGPPLYVFSWFAAAYPNQNRSLGFFLVFRSCPPAKRPFPSRAWLPMSRQGGISVGCGN